jgi:hypothetical protein
MDLTDALMALERSAAAVAAVLPDDLPEAQLLELSEAWGPVPRGGGVRPKVADARCWINWIRSCAGRWEERRPVEPELTADEIHQLLIRWVQS